MMFVRKWYLREEAEEGNDLPGNPPEESQVDKWSDFLSDDEPMVEEEPEADLPPEEKPPAEETPEVAPAEPPAVEPPPAQETPAAQPLTKEQIAELRGQFEAKLVESYAISEEDSLALQTEPEKVLPKMAARLHLEVLDAVMGQLQQALPRYIESYAVTTTKDVQAKNEFFSAWPELQQYESQVLQMGQMFNAMNPKADPQTRIKRIGELTMAALGLQRQAAAETPAAQPQAFRPAAPSKMSSPPPEKTKWERVMEDDDD